MTNLIITIFVVGVLLYLSAYDVSERRIPNHIVLPCTFGLLATLGILGKFMGRGPDFSRATFGFVFTLFLFLALVAISPNGIGMGDVKLSALIGTALAWVSFNALLMGLVAMFVIAGIYSGILLFKNPKLIRSTIPFAPFMTLGYIIGIVMR